MRMRVVVVMLLACMIDFFTIPPYLGAQNEALTAEQDVNIQEEAHNTELVPGPPVSVINTGQDFTKPVRRIDVHYTHKDMAGDAWSESITLHAAWPYTLPNGWVVSVRAEQPYTWIDGVSRSNPQGKRLDGFSEILTEALLIPPPRGKWTYAFGTQWIPPSASHDELGTGRHQIVPSLGIRYDLGMWMQGAWCGMMLRHAFDVAGYSGYDHINQTIWQPIMNIELPDAWFITFAPEIKYDWKNSEWFVPFDTTAGTMVTKNIIASITYKSAINDEMLLYVNMFDGRIGYFF